jgi:very-short-patch-repair endonuclease
VIIPYNKNLRSVAKQLRENQTEAEIEMWNFLRYNFAKFKFLKQVPMDNFIIDFFCKEAKLIIEVDGEVHDFQKERDAERDNILVYKYNLKTVRFTNREVMKNKNHIRKFLNEALHLCTDAPLKGSASEAKTGGCWITARQNLTPC